MAADDGDTAVVSAAQRLEKSDRHNFGSLRNAHARAIFLWLQSRKSFETAEHIR
ncbi:MAG: hypothetical protein JSS43_26080 [Proteobacteria bacterium]|nr:hypothetical protein [Pseudomonadota bacterium]